MKWNFPCRRPKGFRVRGKLIQKNVPDDFVLRVPIYGQGQSGKPVLLGYVVTSGDETSVSIRGRRRPEEAADRSADDAAVPAAGILDSLCFAFRRRTSTLISILC